MTYLNQVQLIGNLGKDPEVLKETKTGSFVRLQIGTNKKYRDAEGQKQEKTYWHTVYLNNGLGKYVSTYYKKGDLAYIAGELQTRQWQDDQGVTHYETAIFADNVQPLALKSRKSSEMPLDENTAKQASILQKVDECFAKYEAENPSA